MWNTCVTWWYTVMMNLYTRGLLIHGITYLEITPAFLQNKSRKNAEEETFKLLWVAQLGGSSSLEKVKCSLTGFLIYVHYINRGSLVTRCNYIKPILKGSYITFVRVICIFIFSSELDPPSWATHKNFIYILPLPFYMLAIKKVYP